ncbi:protein NRT1/ PTR FAMILY 5.8-like isoform X2 [Diospyros lotus]|uniref:protein NRT1/ PTR FAMILY 5.8-like isoform X2 n=1 Tax=Diospyros lotus TaxID=55363 RepID=UPI002250B38C|nr:protein NRT1/ PTR FAMILY 5.8-like isoform X2 [Diospyros lotus]
MGGGQLAKMPNKSCFLLIVVAGLERFAFKGVASNLVTYLTDVVKMSNSAAAKTVSSWCGFTSMVPLLVAPFADSYWDQYSTILVSSSLYVLGLIALTSTAVVGPWAATNKTSFSSSLFWSLYLISLGQGGYNPSLQAFGAFQLEDELEEELPCSKKEEPSSNKKSWFFQWWYFGICSGCLLGVSVMSYIQDTFGWGLGFAIPTIVMVSSVAFFSWGSRFYAYKQQQQQPAKAAADFMPFESLARAVKTTASKVMNVRFTSSSKSDQVELELQEKPICREGLEVGEGQDKDGSNTGTHLLEITRIVLRLLPIWTMLLTFAVIFQQPATFFTKQGMTMERNIGSGFKIPPATLQSAITVSIVLLMPLYDTLFIPLARIVTWNEKGVSVMQRMGIGMFLSVVAMATAALVEGKRLEIGRNSGSETETVPLSIFWLLPQYVLLGISDIFTVVGMQEFFYSEVPVRMRTMGIALYTSVFGVGSFLSALLISVVEYFTGLGGGNRSWFSDDMREARLDKYYWLLASASAVSLLTFVILCRFYKSRL